MTDHLVDIASDLSVFHHIGDAGEMEAAVFYALAFRLPAYSGAMAVVAQKEVNEQGGGSAPVRSARRPAARYERNSGAANNARTADSAPPATAQSLAGLNAQLGGTWFSHKVVPGEVVKPSE